MPRELWDVYSFDRRRTGRTTHRGEDLAPDEFHLVVHICVFDREGRMLIQKRNPQKRSWAGLWDLSAGGCALMGESSQQAAARELFEELGLEADFSNTRPVLTINFEKGFDDVFEIERELEPEELRLQAEEVTQARWATLDEVCALLENDGFVPYSLEFVRLLFDIHRYGAGLRRQEPDI